MPGKRSTRYIFYRYDEDEHGCWIWAGSVCPESGYGMVSFDDRWQRAHRVFYEHFKRKIPKGWVVHHVCEVRRCVNPEHLRAMTRSAHSKLHAPLRSRCSRGHRYTRWNTYYAPKSGRRYCRQCIKIRTRRRARLLAS